MNKSEFTKAKFVCGGDEPFEGWHKPEVRWNGWCCPYFTYATAMRVLRSFGYKPIGNEDGTITSVDPEGDGSTREDAPIHVDGFSEPLYCVGGWEWIWNTVD